MKIKIYDMPYDVEEFDDEEDIELDGYLVDGDITDDPIDGKEPIGYVTLDDGSHIGIYGKSRGKFNPIIPLAGLACVGVIVAGVMFIPKVFKKPIKGELTTNGKYLVTETAGSTDVVFNAIPSIDADGNIDMRFKVSQSATVSISGNGIYMPPTVIEAGVTPTLKIDTVETEQDAVQATLTVESNGAVDTYPIVVEIPQNGSPNYSAEDEPFKGEEIISEVE